MQIFSYRKRKLVDTDSLLPVSADPQRFSLSSSLSEYVICQRNSSDDWLRDRLFISFSCLQFFLGVTWWLKKETASGRKRKKEIYKCSHMWVLYRLAFTLLNNLSSLFPDGVFTAAAQSCFFTSAKISEQISLCYTLLSLHIQELECESHHRI